MRSVLNIQGPFDRSHLQGPWAPFPLDKASKVRTPGLGKERRGGRVGGSLLLCPVHAYLQPLLSLLPALQSQHQHLCGPLGEAQLMPLVSAVLGHVDDGAGIQCQPQMWLSVLGAFVTLYRERRGQDLLQTMVGGG